MKRFATILVFAALMALSFRIWVPTGIALSAETESDESFSASLFYAENANDGFSADRSVSCFVNQGPFRMWRLIPARRIEKIRFDFGRAPGFVRIRNIRLSGRSSLVLDVNGFSFSPDVESHVVEDDGSLAIRSSKPDPYMVYTCPLNMEGTARIQNYWQTSPQVLLWVLAMFVIARFSVDVFGKAFGPTVGNANGPRGPRDRSRRVASFDCIRIAAFLSIVLAHVLERGSASGVPGWLLLDSVHWGRLGVSLFFVLSGASLSIGSLQRNEGFGAFLSRRLRAILPSFWVANFVCAMVAFLRSRATELKSDWLSVPLTVFGADGYLNTRLPTNYHGVGEWFVGALLLVYLLAPALHRVARKRPFSLLCALYLLGALSLRHSTVLSDWVPAFNKIPHFDVVPHLFEFAFGMVFFIHVRPILRRHALAAAGSALFLSAYLAFAPRPLFVCDPLGILASASLFTGFVFLFDRLPFADPAEAVLGSVGRALYLAFLFHHRIIFWVFRKGEALDFPDVVHAVCLVATASLATAALVRTPVAALADVVFGVKKRSPAEQRR